MAFVTLLNRIRYFFTKKKIIWTVVILLVAFLGWYFFIRKPANKTIKTEKVAVKEIKKTVLTTGQVVSSTDLSLSFQASGVVRRINVKEGDKVSVGQTLAVLDQGSASASLESARGSLAQAKANLDKVKSSATTQDIAVSQAAYDSSQAALDNAKQNLVNQITLSFNTANAQISNTSNVLFSNPTSNFPQFGVPGTVQNNTQLVSQVNTEKVAATASLVDWQTAVSGVNPDDLEALTQKSLDNLSKLSSFLTDISNLLTVYTQVSSGGSQSALTTYSTSVISAKSSIDAQYTTLLSSRQALKNANFALAQAKAALTLKQSPARPEDVSIAEAQVISATGSYNMALSAFNNTVIVAPANGTITQIDIKLGEQATAMKQVIKLINVGELHTEAQISEADIASVQVGQTIDNTFDALGPDKHFQSKVLTVNPASTLVSGVVNYKVTGSLENIPDVKPGMTSNMTILVAEPRKALVVPSSAIVNHDGKKFVRVVDDPKAKTYHEVEIQTGLEGDGGLTEVLTATSSKVSEGVEVVTFVK